MSNKVKWVKTAMDGYHAEVIVVDEGVCSYNLHVYPTNGEFDYWIVHNHIIKTNGLPLREEGRFAKTAEQAKQKCEKWMRDEISKIRKQLDKWC